jgi:glycosyltransferase involved in cell wall biosynthesis
MNLQKVRPLVSAVMPVYNCAPYLEEAIWSIRRQTFTDFEFIIVNDGSIDDSPAIIRRHAAADSRIVVIDQPNRGLAPAINSGVSAARGKYIARMDGDDIAWPERFVRQVSELDKNPELAVVGGRAQLCCPAGLILGVEYGRLTSHEAIEEALLRASSPIVHPAATMRADAVQAVGGYRDEYSTVEDLDLFLRLARVGRLGNVPEVVLTYRQHLGSTRYTDSSIQMERATKAVKEGYAARGIPLPEGFKPDWPSTSPVVTLRRWAKNALSHGRLDLARVYIWQALRFRPISPRTWKRAMEVVLGGISRRH